MKYVCPFIFSVVFRLVFRSLEIDGKLNLNMDLKKIARKCVKWMQPAHIWDQWQRLVKAAIKNFLSCRGGKLLYVLRENREIPCLTFGLCSCKSQRREKESRTEYFSATRSHLFYLSHSPVELPPAVGDANFNRSPAKFRGSLGTKVYKS